MSTVEVSAQKSASRSTAATTSSPMSCAADGGSPSNSNVSGWDADDWAHMCILIKEIQNVDGRLWTEYIERAQKLRRDPTSHDWQFLAMFLRTTARENPQVSQMIQRALEAKRASRDRSWEALALQTMGHPYFQRFYSLHDKAESQPNWIRPRQSSSSVPHGQSPCYAISTVIVRTMEESRALLRCVIVDTQGTIQIDEWVRPSGTIVDDLSAYGTTQERLDTIQTTRESLQQQLQQLLTSDTVLVGHSTAQDLSACRLHHSNVVDVGLLCRSFDQPRHSPTLEDIYRSIFPAAPSFSPNDALATARALMEVATYLRDHKPDMGKANGGLPNPIQHSSTPQTMTGNGGAAVAGIMGADPSVARGPIPSEQHMNQSQSMGAGSRSEQQSKLFIHKIPRVVRPEEIQALFQPQPIVGNTKMSQGGTWSALLDFGSPALAMAMFDSVPGVQGQDTKGRVQKSLYIPLMFNSTETQYVEIKIQKAT